MTAETNQTCLKQCPQLSAQPEGHHGHELFSHYLTNGSDAAINKRMAQLNSLVPVWRCNGRSQQHYIDNIHTTSPTIFFLVFFYKECVIVIPIIGVKIQCDNI